MEVQWIKITTNIFDNSKIHLIDSLPDRDAIIVIWFKILALAGKSNNNGVLTMNDKLAYNDEMLSTIFDRPLNTVRLALATFEDFGMIERENHLIMIKNWEKYQNVEGLLKIKEQNRLRQQKHRDKLQLITNNVTSRDSHAIEEDKEVELDLEVEKEIDKDIKINNKTSNIENEFNTLWSLYPNKKGKVQALASYTKAIKNGSTYQEVEQGIMNFNLFNKEKGTEMQFIPYGSTWFNKNRWTDDYTVIKKKTAYDILEELGNE